mgnify:CR=1 FL=1
MNNRDFQYSTTPTTAPQLQFTATVGDRYLVLADGQIGNAAGTAFDAIMYLPGGTDYWHQPVQPVVAGDIFSCPMMFDYTIIEAPPNNFDFTLVPGGSVYSNLIVCAFKLVDGEFASVDASAASTSSATYVSLMTLEDSPGSGTITVPVAGDYLIRAVCNAKLNSSTNSFFVRLVVDGAAAPSYTEATKMAVSATVGGPWEAMVKLNLAAGTHTVTIDVKTNGTDTATISFAKIVMLREDAFPRIFYLDSRSAANANTVYPTYTTKASGTLTARTQDKPHLLLSSWLSLESVNARIVYNRTLQDDTTALAETINKMPAANIEFSHTALSAFTPTVGDHTFKIQGAKDATGAGTGNNTISQAAIALIQMSDDVTVRIRGGVLLGGTIL